MKIILVRHGTTRGLLEKRFQGKMDFPLTCQGLREAQLLAEKLKEFKLHRIYSSPLRRALDTAAPIAERQGLPVITLSFLREFGWGVLEGRSWNDIRSEFPSLYRALKKNFSDTPVPGRESYRHFRGRVLSTQRFLVKTTPAEGTSLLVSHGRFINAFLVIFFGLSFGNSWPFPVSPASVSIVEREQSGNRRLLLFNDTDHLLRG